MKVDSQQIALTACAAAVLAYRTRRASGRRVGTLLVLAAALLAAYLALRKRRALLQDADTTGNDAPPSEASRERPRSASPVYVLPSNAVIVHNVDTAASEASELQTLLSRELAGEVVMAASWHHDLAKLEALVKKPDSTLVLVCSEGVLHKATELMPVLAAIDAKIPIVAVQLPSHEVVPTAAFLARLDSRLASAEAAVLRRTKRNLLDSAWKLSVVVPTLTPVVSSESGAAAMEPLCAAVLDALRDACAAPPQLDGSLEAWLAQRDRPLRYDGDGAADGANIPGASTSRSSMSVSVPEGAAVREGASVPALAPQLPEGYEERTPSRLALLHEAKHLSLSRDFRGCRKLSLRGTGGAGKTVLATALVRDVDMLGAFEVAAWVTVSEKPDLPACLRSTLEQFGGSASGVADADLRAALQQQLAQRDVLLVLDDVWQSDHAAALCALDEATSSCCLVSTRVTNVLRAAVELNVGLMEQQEAVALLLRVAQKHELIPSPPAAALEAVELCGRLPLLLYMAGSMIEQFEGPGEWTEWIVPQLSADDNAALRKETHTHVMDSGSSAVSSIEMRVIGTSLRSGVGKDKTGVTLATFLAFAIFPEDTVVPAAVFDALADSIVADAKPEQGVRPARGKAAANVRKALLALLRCSLVQGSMGGLSQHDIVRGYAVATVKSNGDGDGGMLERQRSAVGALLEACRAAEPPTELKRYVVAHFPKHVAGATVEGRALCDDALLLSAVLSHPDDDVKRGAASGLGAEAMIAAVEQSEAAGAWVRAAQLWLALAQLRENGDDRRKAWLCMERVSPPTAESARLEGEVIKQLLIKAGGIKAGTDEARKAKRRSELLLQVAGCEEDPAIKRAIYLCNLFDVYLRYVVENNAKAPRPPTLVAVRAEIWEKAGGAARDSVAKPFHDDKDAIEGFARLTLLPHMSHIHAADTYEVAAEWGEGGKMLRACLARYEYDVHHELVKSKTGMEPLCTGFGGSLLMLFWGDLAAARADWASSAASWPKIRKLLQKGKAKPQGYGVIACMSRGTRALAYSHGQLETFRTLYEAHPDGWLLHDASTTRPWLEAMCNAVQSHARSFGAKHASWSAESAALISRATGALLLPDASPAMQAAAEWLPPPQALVRIAEEECLWDTYLCGVQHPALACALLYAKLRRWDEAAAVASGLLKLVNQPLVRIESSRLLARCQQANGQQKRASSHLRSAADDARRAHYVLLELLIRRELLQLEPKDAEAAAACEALAKRVQASEEEMRS